MTHMKKCVKCSIDKNLNEFYNEKTSKDKKSSWCKKCHLSYDKTRNRDMQTKLASEREPQARWKRFLREAKKYKRQIFLTQEQFNELLKQPCYYCNDPIGSSYGYSLDRINNENTYTIANCVPCCSMCNQMKRQFNQIDFINKCIKIGLKHNQN